MTSAFQPGDEQDPRHADGNVIYDPGATPPDTWRAMESRARFNAVVETGVPGFTPRKT